MSKDKKETGNDGFEEIVQGTMITATKYFTEVNKSVIGKLLGIRKNEKYNNNLYDLEVDGEKTTLAGTSNLDFQITPDLVGKTLKVTYIGEEKSKSGRLFKKFKVFTKTE